MCLCNLYCVGGNREPDYDYLVQDLVCLRDPFQSVLNLFRSQTLELGVDSTLAELFIDSAMPFHHQTVLFLVLLTASKPT